MKVRRLTPGTFHRLTELGRSSEPVPWVDEVEEFLFVDVPAQRGAATGSRVLLLLDQAGPVAAAAHRPHPRFAAEHLQAFVVAVERRGQRLGELALRDTIEWLHVEDSREWILWHVDARNDPMLEVSARIGDEVTRDGPYVVFTHP